MIKLDELKPYIVLKALIVTLLVLTLIPNASYNYLGLYANIYIILHSFFFVIFIIGTCMNLFFIKNKQFLDKIGYWGIILAIIGFAVKLVLDILFPIGLYFLFQLRFYASGSIIVIMVLERKINFRNRFSNNVELDKKLEIEILKKRVEMEKIENEQREQKELIHRKEQERFKKEKKKKKESELKNRYQTIEKLIREIEIETAIVELQDLKRIAVQHNFDSIIEWAEKNLYICDTHIIKKTVLELGTKFARLQIAEISEICGIKDENMIIDIVKVMINNNEIYAQYFSSTKALAFDQQANIAEIDKLMETYKEWEEKEIGKK